MCLDLTSIKYAITHATPSSFLKLQQAALQEEASKQAYDDSNKHIRDSVGSLVVAAPSKSRVWVPHTALPPTSTKRAKIFRIRPKATKPVQLFSERLHQQ